MKRKKSNFFFITLYSLYFFSFAIILYLIYRGYAYYSLSLQERVHSDLHPLWKPGGSIGHGLGVIGSTMMILMLSYSLRKRVTFLKNFGPLNYWLHIHIYFGIIGPILVILHSSFKLNGIISVAFWAMISVALSGILGRFIYLQIPRDIFGNELTIVEAKDIEAKLIHELTQTFQLDEHDISNLSRLSIKEIKVEWNSFKVLWIVFVQNLTLIFRKKKILYQIFREIRSRERAKEVFDKLVEHAKLQQRIELWSRLHSIFHYWYVFHKPFAYIMYLIMIVHVAIAIWLGYTWL